MSWSMTRSIFSLINNRVIVAPVGRKLIAIGSKPREHFLLKQERPSFITILCLVRDAAARLPNGVGTRIMICELLKESQYITEGIPEEKLSGVVSGALDRLHYEDDPCVRYDLDKKLWIYLHRDRPLDYSSNFFPNNRNRLVRQLGNAQHQKKRVQQCV